jgi:hypothetical protein
MAGGEHANDHAHWRSSAEILSAIPLGGFIGRHQESLGGIVPSPNTPKI